jgi:hypothetical protein
MEEQELAVVTPRNDLCRWTVGVAVRVLLTPESTEICGLLSAAPATRIDCPALPCSRLRASVWRDDDGGVASVLEAQARRSVNRARSERSAHGHGVWILCPETRTHSEFIHRCLAGLPVRRAPFLDRKGKANTTPSRRHLPPV